MSITTSGSHEGNTQRRWSKWIGVTALILILVVGAAYATEFARIVPLRSVRVLDALTGKPLAGMNVCLQVVSNGWTKQALKMDLKKTDSDGRAFFPTFTLNLGLLQSIDGYSVQVTDPKTAFGQTQTCGPQVGFKQGPSITEGAEKFATAHTDGSEHFPVELVKAEDVPKNIRWYPFIRAAAFDSSMSVQLVPVLPSADDCKQIVDPLLVEECIRLNTKAHNDSLQAVVPLYFAGMQRVADQTSDGGQLGPKVYNATYQTRSIPAIYTDVFIEQFPNSRTALEHFNDLSHEIPDYDPSSATEDEPVPGERMKWFAAPKANYAFWISENNLILIMFLTPSHIDQGIAKEWMMRYPSTIGSSTR